MSRKEKSLPIPPNRPFGRKRNGEREEEQALLLSDRMAAAAAEGKLEEFLEKEMPDNEYARNLAKMMMGMTGMMPAAGVEMKQPSASGRGSAEPAASFHEIPEDVQRAIQGGDVKGLMDMLRREHQKRTPGAEEGPVEEAPAAHSADQPTIDKEIIDALIKIASDNGVTLDWLILRAIRVYVEEYRKTGKL